MVDGRVLGSWPWPFMVMWRHRSRDHLIPLWPFLFDSSDILSLKMSEESNKTYHRPTIRSRLCYSCICLSSSFVTLCIVARRCVLEQKLLHCVQKKKHPLIFSFISPWIICGFKQKLQWIYPRIDRLYIHCDRWRNYDVTFVWLKLEQVYSTQ